MKATLIPLRLNELLGNGPSFNKTLPFDLL